MSWWLNQQVLAGLGGMAPLPSGYNIIIAAGQSNMQGATPLLVGADDQTQTNLYIWGTAKGLGNFHTIFLGADPLPVPATGGLNTGNTNYAIQFARQYAVATGKKTLLVFVPVANTDLAGSIQQWKYTATPANPPTYTGNAITTNLASNLYSNMIYEANLAVAAAVAADSGSAIVGLLWAQGENDSTQISSATLPTYNAAFGALVDGFRAQVTGASNAWVLVNSMLPEAKYDEPLNHTGIYANFRLVDRAQKLITAQKPRMAYIQGAWGYSDRTADTGSGQLGAIHYRNRGAWGVMAPKAISALSTVRTKTTGAAQAAPAAPTILAATATSGQSVRLQLSRDYTNSNTDLIIQYALTGTGSWVTYNDGTAGTFDYAEMLSIGGLTASTAYDFRVADKNAAGTSAYSNTISATTTSSVAGYDFEADTAGSPPTGITQMTGLLNVIAGGTSTQGTVYGKSIATSGSSAGSSWSGWLDKIPHAADRTVTFRLIKDNASNSGQVKVTLRAKADALCGSGYSDEPLGYGFIVDYQGVTLKISVAGDSGDAVLSSSFFGQKVDQWYRVSCIGTTIKFEYSANGSSWTTFSTQTDSTYTHGGVHLNIRNLGAPNQLYIDNITWS